VMSHRRPEWHWTARISPRKGYFVTLLSISLSGPQREMLPSFWDRERLIEDPFSHCGLRYNSNIRRGEKRTVHADRSSQQDVVRESCYRWDPLYIGVRLVKHISSPLSSCYGAGGTTYVIKKCELIQRTGISLILWWHKNLDLQRQ
jgi:hypothetical protein